MRKCVNITYMKTAIVIIMLLMINCMNAKNSIGLTQEVYFDLCGTWSYIINLETNDYEYSWGKGKSCANVTVEIDFGADKPYLLESGMGLHEIKQITKKGNLYIITMTYTPSQKDKIVYLAIEVNDEETIRFVQVKDDDNFYEMDSISQPYYKYSGPEKVYYRPKSVKVTISERPKKDSKIIRQCKDNEKIIIIALGKKITSTRWVKILTENGEIGWCLKNELVELKSIK